MRFCAAHLRVEKHCCCSQLCIFLMAIELFLYSCNRLTSDTVNLEAVNNLLGSWVQHPYLITSHSICIVLWQHTANVEDLNCMAILDLQIWAISQNLEFSNFLICTAGVGAPRSYYLETLEKKIWVTFFHFWCLYC